MKFRIAFISFLLIVVCPSFVPGKDKSAGNHQKIERSLAVDPAVVVSLCVDSGDVTVRGWNKNEVLARSAEVGRIELKRSDVLNSGAAAKVTVWLADKVDGPETKSGCQAFGDVQLMVPRGASIYLQTGDGVVDVVDVASVFARSESGDVSIQRAKQSIEAISFSGAIAAENSTGRISMRTVSGMIRATNLRPNDGDDCFEAMTTSGDIELDGVAHQQVTVKTTSGNIAVAGPLAKQGTYNLATTSSDVTLNLPKDSSFRLNARLSRDRDLNSEFPLTLTIEDPMSMPAKKAMPAKPSAPPAPDPKIKEPDHKARVPVVVMVDPEDSAVKVKPVVVKSYYALRRINAIYGSGDALITIASFSGSINLRESGN